MQILVEGTLDGRPRTLDSIKLGSLGPLRVSHKASEALVPKERPPMVDVWPWLEDSLLSIPINIEATRKCLLKEGCERILELQSNKSRISQIWKRKRAK